jgi:hypothetical protein
MREVVVTTASVFDGCTAMRDLPVTVAQAPAATTWCVDAQFSHMPAVPCPEPKQFSLKLQP